jgi:hypothetical protein
MRTKFGISVTTFLFTSAVLGFQGCDCCDKKTCEAVVGLMKQDTLQRRVIAELEEELRICSGGDTDTSAVIESAAVTCGGMSSLAVGSSVVFGEAVGKNNLCYVIKENTVGKKARMVIYYRRFVSSGPPVEYCQTHQVSVLDGQSVSFEITPSGANNMIVRTSDPVIAPTAFDDIQGVTYHATDPVIKPIVFTEGVPGVPGLFLIGADDPRPFQQSTVRHSRTNMANGNVVKIEWNATDHISGNIRITTTASAHTTGLVTPSADMGVLRWRCDS